MQDWDTRIKNLKTDIQIAREKYVVPFLNAKPKTPPAPKEVIQTPDPSLGAMVDSKEVVGEKIYENNDPVSSLDLIDKTNNTEKNQNVGLTEEKVRVISTDIGGGFGGKVPVYPGYVIAIAASFLIGKPVKWIEDRSENLQADSFARDYHITAELAGTKDGKILATRMKVLADHGYTDASANPSKFPTGMFSIATGSYDYSNAFMEADAVYTNKPPGGVAYRCSFRVTEAVHAIERMTDRYAHEICLLYTSDAADE